MHGLCRETLRLIEVWKDWHVLSFPEFPIQLVVIGTNGKFLCLLKDLASHLNLVSKRLSDKPRIYIFPPSSQSVQKVRLPLLQRKHLLVAIYPFRHARMAFYSPYDTASHY